MPRDIYNDGELVTDDIGRLWLVSALKTGVGLLMPELPDFLSQQEEKKAAVEGFEFDQMVDGIAAEREACAKIADGCCETCPCGCGGEISAMIRSRK
jgi:hypothetical protein